MSRPHKLGIDSMRVIREKLRRRDELLRELRAYSVKQIASEHGVSDDLIRRIDEAIHGIHRADPRVCRFEPLNVLAQVN